ncbi:MAG: response regulator, partial [Mariprofundaceae bacterium]|nr:response regulator [Mariprofundaceae bacterium]
RARIVRGEDAVRRQASGVRHESSKSSSSPLTPQPLLNGDVLEISVSDTGIGIAKADLERIFMPFEKVDGSMSRRYEGTGLGLILIKSMVELHGGGVSVESEPDKGSTFTVRVPYRQTSCEAETPIQPCYAAPTAHHEPESAQMASDQRPLALIVEDDYGSAEVMRLNLENNGLQSQRAATAEGALHWLATHKPDLIVLDIMLPLINGLDFLAILKKHNHGSDIPVIVASSAADENKQKAYSLGAAAILQKPVDIKTLAGALAELGFARNMES